jgi:hypothetical protein
VASITKQPAKIKTGVLYKIPICLVAKIEADLGANAVRLRVAEVRLRAGLEIYRPRLGAPYPKQDAQLSLTSERAGELAAKLKS